MTFILNIWSKLAIWDGSYISLFTLKGIFTQQWDALSDFSFSANYEMLVDEYFIS